MNSDTLAERIIAILDRHGHGLTIDTRAAAQHILAAMRTPTSRVTKAGADVPVGCCMTNSSDAGAIWDYMIEAALAEAKTSAAS